MNEQFPPDAMIVEQDYFLRHFSYISLARAKRPHDFAGHTQPSLHPDQCSFCPGYEEQAPAEIGRLDDGAGGWKMRWFPNKFPAVSPQTPKAYGYQEVIVETPDRQRQLWDFSDEELQMVSGVYQERLRAVSQDERIQSIALFKNHGKEAGASLVHSHTQLIASDKLFSSFQQKKQAMVAQGSCTYCALITSERQQARFVKENEHFMIFCPKAPRFAMEAWIVAKSHEGTFTTFTPDVVHSFSELWGGLLRSLKQIDAPYCFELVFTPHESPLHFHAELLPRLHAWAGFELASGDYIIPTPAEHAARFYRGESTPTD